jgi:hypothetical protein
MNFLMGRDKDMVVNSVPWKNPCRKKWNGKKGDGIKGQREAKREAMFVLQQLG